MVPVISRPYHLPDEDQLYDLLKRLDDDKREELHGLVDQNLLRSSTTVRVSCLSLPVNLRFISFVAYGIRLSAGKRKGERYCMPIVQSSGYGKSRTVQQASFLRFELPFNLREELLDGYVGE